MSKEKSRDKGASKSITNEITIDFLDKTIEGN